MPIRVFLDANVLFSCAWREGSRLQTSLLALDAVLLASEGVLEEAARNLDTPEQRERLDHLARSLEIVTDWEQVTLPENLELREKDHHVVKAAMAGRADYLVTGDHRDFGKFFGSQVLGITVHPPADFFKAIGNS